MEIETLVREANKGDKVALQGLVAAIQDDVYYLALRMLANPEHARDATQDILIRVITKLSTFGFRSSFKTWVYSLASNYLLSEKKVLDRDLGLNFQLYQADLHSDLQEPAELRSQPEYPLMINELRISCTMAMLLCLKPAYRMAYILGDIFEIQHREAADILSITPANFRQQLSRARASVVEFMQDSCGLVSNQAACSCDRKLPGAVQRGRVNQGRYFFANKEQVSVAKLRQRAQQTREDLRALTVQRSIEAYKCPMAFADTVDELVAGIESDAKKV